MRGIMLLALVAAACSQAKATSQTPDDSSPPMRGSLAEELSAEAAERPASGPRAEDVFAAFAREHEPVAGTMQVLARPVRARYCASGRTAAGLGVVVCEYDSEDAARRGRDQSERVFGRAIPNRTLAVHRTALLTLTRPTADPAMAAEADRLSGLFQTL
jgi:hypothetical protein